MPLTLKKNLQSSKTGEIGQAKRDRRGDTGYDTEQQVKRFSQVPKRRSLTAPARDFQEVLAGRAYAHITSNVEAGKLVEKYPQMAVVPSSRRGRVRPLPCCCHKTIKCGSTISTTGLLEEGRGFFDKLASKWQIAN